MSLSPLWSVLLKVYVIWDAKGLMYIQTKETDKGRIQQQQWERQISDEKVSNMFTAFWH